MQISTLTRGVKLFVSNHGPEIATALSVAASINTAVLASKASIKAHEEIQLAEEELGGPLEERKARIIFRARLVWRTYIPTLISGAATVTLIIASNRLSSKRQAAIASVLASTQGYLANYKDSIKEVLDEETALKVKEKVAQKTVDKSDAKAAKAIIFNDGDTLIFEPLSGRYFRSSMNDVTAAVNRANASCIQNFSVTLNEFFSELGLEDVGIGEMVGWNTDSLIDVIFDAVISDDGEPALAISYDTEPTAKFNHFR